MTIGQHLHNVRIFRPKDIALRSGAIDNLRDVHLFNGCGPSRSPVDDDFVRMLVKLLRLSATKFQPALRNTIVDLVGDGGRDAVAVHIPEGAGVGTAPDHAASLYRAYRNAFRYLLIISIELVDNVVAVKGEDSAPR
jgi:hypothetical protein